MSLKKSLNTRKLFYRIGLISVILAFSFMLINCAATFPKPDEVSFTNPLETNEGKFLCPYTSDGVVAPWVEKGTVAKIGANVGSYAGRKAGEEALKAVPVFGGLLGQKAGDAAGREAALALVGGREYMRETSDLSFEEIDDMIVYLYANYSTNEHWDQVYDLTKEIYPDLERRWQKAIKKAAKPK